MADFDEPPLAEPMGQQGQRFGRGELGADAGSRPRAERQILKAMPPALFGEAIDVEGVRIGPQLAVAMEDPGPNREDVAWLDIRIPPSRS